MTEPNTQEMIERGKIAKQFLDSPVFVAVMKGCEAEFTMRWKETTNEKLQFAAWASIHALAEVESQLRTIANNGIMAEEVLKKQA